MTRRLLDRLSPAERDVLAHLARGRAVREIAVMRNVGEATVRTQVKAILTKLDVGTQLAAVVRVYLDEKVNT